MAIGGQDQKCAAFGAGIAGDVITLSLGTAGAIEKIYDYPFVDPARKTPSFSFLSPRMWIAEGVVDTAAGAMRWLKDTLFPDCSYGQMSALAQQALCSPLFFHPHLCGDSSVGNKKNACGNYYNISLHTKRGEFVSSLMEGVAFEINESFRRWRRRKNQRRRSGFSAAGPRVMFGAISLRILRKNGAKGFYRRSGKRGRGNARRDRAG